MYELGEVECGNGGWICDKLRWEGWEMEGRMVGSTQIFGHGQILWSSKSK